MIKSIRASFYGDTEEECAERAAEIEALLIDVLSFNIYVEEIE